MKKIICTVICLLALTACGSTDNTPAAETAASAETEVQTSEVSQASAETEDTSVHKNDGENPPPEEQKGNVIRVTAVDGNVITGEKMSGGRGFGGGRPEGGGDENMPQKGDMPEDGSFPEGEPPAMPEDGSMPEGEPPAMPEGENMPEKGERPDGDRPAGETVTFTITDSTAMDMESISEGDMIIAELSDDGTAVSVKKADFDKQPDLDKQPIETTAT